MKRPHNSGATAAVAIAAAAVLGTTTCGEKKSRRESQHLAIVFNGVRRDD